MKVVVIGAGVVGVTTAWALARHGMEVLVLEKNAAPALGTSHANSGMLTPSMADPWNAPGVLWHVAKWIGREDAPFLLRSRELPHMVGWGLRFLRESAPARFRRNAQRNLSLATYSLACLRELRETLALPHDALSRGTLRVFRDAQGRTRAEQRNAVLKALGLELTTMSPAELASFEPSLAPVADRLAGAVYCPSDESGDARAFTQALADKARESGVQFRYGAEVTGAEIADGRVNAIFCGEERIDARSFVLCAGPQSPHFGEQLGLKIPIRPVKGYSITLDASGWTGAPSRPVIDETLHAAVTPFGHRLRVAGTAELAGWDDTVTPARIDNLFDLTLALFPSIGVQLDRANAQPWAGLRPVVPDGVPLLGRTPHDNFFVNVGHGHLGWTLAAGSAQLVADLVAGLPPRLDLSEYDPQRFQ